MIAGYVGTDPVEKIYLGSELVWSNTPPGPDYSQMYFTIEAISAGTINFVKEVDAVPDVVLDYSMDDGVSWTTFTSTTAGTQIQVAAGDKVLFKGINSGTGVYATYGTRGNTFSGTTATIKAYGNVMSLLYGDGFYSATTFQSGVDRVLGALFRNTTALTDASNLVLPVMDFSNNTGCYAHMFFGCTSLTGVPALPATGLSEGCYGQMFEDCTSITVAPELPATTLAGDCYFRMFMGCTSLVTPPELPALTTVGGTLGGCYYLMFAGCTSLTDSPVLPAATVVAGGSSSLAYGGMFSGCTSLTAITCLATTIEVYSTGWWNTSYGTQNWVSGVAASGTFYKDPNMTGWTTGVSGIPSGWTVQDYTPPA